MSEEENGEGYTKGKKKQVDININVSRDKKDDVPTVSEAEQVAKELSAITGEDVSPAVTVSEFNKQKNQLRLEIATEIGEGRERRSSKKAHERTSFPRASGTARLSAEQITGEDFQGVTGDLSRMEFDSFEDMIQTLKELSSEGDVEAREYLRRLWKKGVKEQGRKNIKAVYVGKISKIGIRPNESILDEEHVGDVKEKIRKEMGKWKEEED